MRPLRLRNMTLSVDFSIYGERYVHADRQRLKQVLLNLLSNAIKFNRTNGSIVLRCQEAQNQRLRIEVADTGSGIDETGLKKIFTPFERLESDRNAVEGTGLGLALSKRMIEAMGGIIGVDSVVGVGSTFYFELPLANDPVTRRDESATGTSVRGSLVQQGASLRGTVLYIEDNLANLRLMQEVLAPYLSVRLLEAMQGKMGLELAQTCAPDWILLDVHLPDITGEEVLHRLRQDARTQKIPVTVLSADATLGQIERLKAMGARDYVTKPLDVTQVITLLESTLRGEEAETQTGNALDPSVGPKQAEATLTVLPAELLQQLLSAVQDGEKDRLDELIAVVADQDSPSAVALKELADRYEYDALTNLLTEAIQ